MSDEPAKYQTREDQERAETLFAAAQELHDKIAAVDPNLVVQMTFGHRRLSGLVLGDVDQIKRGSAVESFRNSWADGGHFGNAFSKTGDGFTNISWLTDEKKVLTE